MSDVASSVLKRRRLSSSGRRNGIYDTSANPDSIADVDVDDPSSDPVDLRHKAIPDPALLHFLDGYYIKRHTVDPWNTSGGFCDVFTGDHPTFGKVAMKRPRMSGDECTESQLRSFVSEGDLWKELRHPNILQFVGMIRSTRHVWLVSVFADHGTLRDFIVTHPGADRHNLVFQFTAGLAYLHSKPVIHGDLKSLNLFISGKGMLLIGDFGLSKFAGMTTAASKKGVGSTNWMAPELLFQEPSTKTLSSDVYAYGITISEILSGRLPFSQYTHQFALMTAMSKNERPLKIPGGSPDGRSYEMLWAVAEDCWDPQPSKRPSMAQVCSRFSLNYTKAIEGVVLEGVRCSNETNQPPGMTESAPSSSEAVPLIRDSNFALPPVSGTFVSINPNDSHVLRVLGDADYGDTGHMLDDGICLDGTRVEILKRLDTWADDHSSPRVVLIKGQAGRGKSTIARSVFSRCRERWGENGSSGIFHFRRNNEALNDRCLRALARQLGCGGAPRVRSAILKTVHAREDVAQLRLEEQFQVLFVQSLKPLEPDPPRVLLVIDALDECSDLSLISALLRLIRKHASSLPSTVKFLLTSRPEERIISPFNTSLEGVQEDLDAVDLALIDRDVRAYFTTRLHEIQRDFGLEAVWLSSEAIDELVSLSQGVFQWANAAMEYVREQPRSRLQRLVRSPTIVLGLPALYREILSTAFPLRTEVDVEDNHLGLFQHVIGSLVVAHQPMSPAILEYLWDQLPDPQPFSDPALEISESILGRLGSILILPSSPDGLIHFMHASIRDFFMNPTQCTDARFLIDPAVHHVRLADTCFRRMKRDLKHDICGINEPSKMNSEVVDLVGQRISPGLCYCCQSWTAHLSETSNDGVADGNKLRTQLHELCTLRIMHWLEVLSLTGVFSDVFDMVQRAIAWVESEKYTQSQRYTQTTALLDDTYDFCRRFFQPMATNALHITSCLHHFPNKTTLRNVYDTSIDQDGPRIIRGPTFHHSHWFRSIPTGGASCAALSPDSRLLASGNSRGVIQLWNTNTGETKGKLSTRNNDWVRSITFSPDGKIIASGSQDGTIRLWTVATEEQKGDSFTGHTQEIRRITFSPDSMILASASNDGIVRLWDVGTGEQKGALFIGHKDRVASITFSPDGKILASGSYTGTIRLWTVTTGKQKGAPLVGHTFGVASVAFSPDGKILASGWYDGTVWLWTVATGKRKGEPLVGHTDWVRSVTFSPDGKILASGSDDCTIRLWTISTGEQKGKPFISRDFRPNSVGFSPDGKIFALELSSPTLRLWTVHAREQKEESLIGHTREINCIAFSPNYAILASGSSDGIIRLWNVNTGKQKGVPLVGHTDRVASVTFSPDGNILASGSNDGTISLWNVATGERKGEPLIGHADWVRSVMFSPNGEFIASGSKDRTVRLWAVHSGEQMGMPLAGHTDRVTSIAFSPDGKILASGSYDSTVRLWTVANGNKKEEPLVGHTDWVRSVTFSPDGKILASGSYDCTVRLWSVDTGQQTGEPLVGHTHSVSGLTFSPDGKSLISKSPREVFHWRLGRLETGADEEHFDDVSRRPEPVVTLFDAQPPRASELGWVFVRGKRCFWLPEEFYLDRSRTQVQISLSGSLLVLHHPNLHILDISAFL